MTAGIRAKPLAHKRTGLPVGVSCSYSSDGLRYLVNWVDAEGVARIKTFYVGHGVHTAADTRRRAEAIAFRKAYEKRRG